MPLIRSFTGIANCENKIQNRKATQISINGLDCYPVVIHTGIFDTREEMVGMFFITNHNYRINTDTSTVLANINSVITTKQIFKNLNLTYLCNITAILSIYI